MKQMTYLVTPSSMTNRSLASVNKRFVLLTLATLITVLVATFGLVSRASAQSPSTGLAIQNLTITQSGVSASVVTYDARVTIVNSSDTDFSGVQRVDYQIDGGDKQLAYIVTALQAGQTLIFTFSFHLSPGEHTISVILAESEVSRSVSVASADIFVEIIEHRVKRGRTVEFVIAVSNLGTLTASDLILSATWSNSSVDSSGRVVYVGIIPNIAPAQTITEVIPLQVQPGSYHFSFKAGTSTIEGVLDNNSADLSLDVEFIDLHTNVVATESLGWDGEGNALMSVTVEVTNEGVDDANTFYIGVGCDGQWEDSCSTSSQSDEISAGGSVETEMRLWLPIGSTPIRIFAVEDEDTFRWGNLNAIDHIIEVPDEPDLVWTLSKIATPEVATYWSDGSANVDLDLTFVNNGTNEPQLVVVECSLDDVTVDGCGAEFSVEKETDVYPTVIKRTLRLPSGETNLAISYGATEPKSISTTVPERITGIERDVWDCFSDTSNIDDDFEQDDQDSDEGVGCAGWDREHVTKWPVGEAIKLWSYGDAYYLKILDEVLQDATSFLNLEIERVATENEAQLKVYAGVVRENADSTGMDCVDSAGCARTWVADDGRITASTVAIWSNRFENEKQRDTVIRSTTLHELLHAFTNMQHRHHDRSSIMSYEALNYTTIDGMDRGLFALHAHPLVEPGMSFDEIRDLIVFADELNDPPEPVELSAPSLLRRTHAALMDAESFSFEVRGGWPGCQGNHDFGWAQLEAANLLPYAALWRHFHDGNDRYYYVGNLHDWGESEWWLRRGRNWNDVNVQRVTDATTFRGGFSSLLQTLADINVYANASDYTAVSRYADRIEIVVNIDEPNPLWSRGLNLEISIAMHPENYQILKYEMTWNFNPRDRRSCDTYTIEARSPQYGIDFMFPDAIREDSQILAPETIPDESDIKVEVATVN